MIQLLLHLLGDFGTQSHWMAENKTRRSWPCLLHVILYTAPFMILSPSWTALGVIGGSHFLIDRFGLARYAVWLKNVVLSPHLFYFDELDRDDDDPVALERFVQYQRLSWANCCATGYPADLPRWLAVGLLIVADNTIHLIINWAALGWL